MKRIDLFQEHISKKVYGICIAQGVRPSECEDIISCFLNKVPEVDRPTIAGVQMETQRKLWEAAGL